MTDSLFSVDTASQPQTPVPWDESSDYAPTPGNFGHTPSTQYSFSPSPHRTLQGPDQLGFLPLAEWQEGGEYEEYPPRYICYTIAWRIVLNRKIECRDTEQDLVIAPSDYWKESLKAKMENLLHVKRRNRRIRSEGTAIVVSVNDRSQNDLEKHYHSTNIDWAPVERQLRRWSNLLRMGKKLRVVISFNYGRDDTDDMSTARKVDKRGRVSATRKMLTEPDAQIDAEENSTGRPSDWRFVYERMRCEARSCQSSWCWEDPRDKKHYKLRSSHLTRLVEYVKDGGVLESHNDVPSDVRQDLYLESQHQAERGAKRANNLPETGAPYPPISINVLPAQTSHASVVPASSLKPSTSDERLVIPGPRDAAVRDYCKWLESKVTDETYKADFRKACEVTLAHHLDLELVFEDQDPNFFIGQGVKRGTARRFVRDIPEWAEKYCHDTVEDDMD
ncbi:hypothetical protein KXV92_007769 [Aspergillus fumigatus]|nr:hypothetical protein KXW88_003309 [Aspergillus fumigatus]KAH2362291.1 hypothetical protein KXV98_005621 [Aspergillus fumigatus]KAH3181484.1 hypothetical protein KXV92_007769 [Aspergillus fumigatus]KAJ8227117.1 hypothetical protein LV156_008786 [Aspergillus fumigatus]KAJ8227882.1 hypothetical protein LV160_008988 [Aspergillus fumigatus]